MFIIINGILTGRNFKGKENDFATSLDQKIILE